MLFFSFSMHLCFEARVLSRPYDCVSVLFFFQARRDGEEVGTKKDNKETYADNPFRPHRDAGKTLLQKLWQTCAKGGLELA